MERQTKAQKYIKPRSLTWWAGFTPALAGVAIATEPLHGQAAVVTSIQNMVGDVPAAVLIANGMGFIGLRGALG